MGKAPLSHFIFVTLMILLLSGCGGTSATEIGGGGSSVIPEDAVCNTTQSISGATTTVSGTAQYRDRDPTHSGSIVTENNTATAIQRAEIWVLNSANQRVQCGETSATGSFSLTIPATSDTYTLAVLSRSDSSYYKARVLSDPINNYLYALEYTWASSGSAHNAGTIIAANDDADATAGAFNILDQIRLANERLDTATTFTAPAPSIPIYWTAGLSPGYYLNAPSVAVSFYLNATSGNLNRGLYILGGLQSEKNCADTDQFDDSIILHEYGHYLEDQYSGSDSPGGSHNGNMVIDPRLAWSEGFANFFNAFARNNATYNDYFGNSSCTSTNPSVGIALNLGTMTNHQDKLPANYSSGGVNYTISPYFFDYDAGGETANSVGEGVFREVSVSRHLWDVFSGDGISQIWLIFDDETVGMGSSSTKFRNVGMFNYLYNAYSPTTAMTNSSATEYQALTRDHYAAPLTVRTCTLSMTPENKIGDGTGSTYLHLHRSARFYEYTYDGSTGSTITVDNLGSQNIDLRVYSADHVLIEDTGFSTDGLIGSSTNNGSTSDEQVSLAGQAAGKYLIVVYAANTTTSSTHSQTTFTINNGVNQLCPPP